MFYGGYRALHVERRQVAGLAAELHRDQVDWLVQPAVLVRVAPLLQLRHGGALAGALHDLELEHVYVAVEANRHVQASVAAAVLHRDVEPQGREVGIEHARVVALVAGDVVLRVPLVRDAGEERLEQTPDAGEVIGPQQLVELDVPFTLSRRVRRQGAQQALVQALAHLPVGKAQPVEDLSAEVLLAGDREVACLKQ